MNQFTGNNHDVAQVSRVSHLELASPESMERDIVSVHWSASNKAGIDLGET